MKWLLTILLLTAAALGQSQYGADYILLRAVTPDGNSNLNFGNLPRPGFSPSASPIGAVSLYFDSAAGCIKASINGGAYACLGGGGTGTVTNTGNSLPSNFVVLGNTAPDIKADTGLSTNGSGAMTTTTGGTALTHTQGTITTSNPTFSHTATWNAGGVAFTDWIQNITATAAAANSFAAKWGIGGNDYAIEYFGTNGTVPAFVMPNGTNAAPSICFTGDCAAHAGFYRNTAGETTWSVGSVDGTTMHGGGGIRVRSLGIVGFTAGGSTAAADSAFSRISAGVIGVGTGAQGNVAGTIQAGAYQTGTNCASSGGTCGSAASGSVSIAAAASTVTVATTAVTANSVIILSRDDTLGTKLSVTCNTATAAGDIKTSTRTAGTSFVITVQNAPATNPLCLNYWIVN